MDCEKFDQVLIDALYDELDELTLAAAKRHADGCPRCHAAWTGFKATRKIGILPLVEAPAGLDERLIAAAREAQRNVAWPKRLGRAVSWAGNYAMRPQVAMAAILLLMLGSSVIFVRAKPDRSGAPTRVHVTERGVPEHAGEMLGAAPPPMAGAPPASPMAANDDRAAASSGAASAYASRELAAAEPEQKLARGGDKFEGFAEAPRARRTTEFSNAPSETAPTAPQALALEDRSRESASGAGAGAAPSKKTQRDTYASAIDLYGAGRYVEAEKAFREVAAGGSKNAPQAALFAAKSAEAAFGCGKAAPMYEAAASRYGATTPGAESLWGAANCYKSIGSYDKATIFYNELRKVAGYRDRAEAELASLHATQQNRVAARKAAADTASEAPASGPAAAAAPASPPAAAPAVTRAQPSNAAKPAP
jgi:hypothetical protein